MPPRISIRGACRPLAVRSIPHNQYQQPGIAALARRHLNGDAKPPPSSPSPLHPFSQPRGSPYGAPPLGPGLPNIPQSMMPPGELSPQQPMREEDVQMRDLTDNERAVHQLQRASYGLPPERPEYTGYKFEAPPMPKDKLPLAQYHMRHRYEEGISQLTRLLMRDGKLSKAQNDMAMILNFLRTSPAPKVNPQRPLLPGAPPPEHLPLNPNLYLMLAIDSVAPLIKIRGFTGLAGGGKALEVPVPMSKRARRRTAFSWIMDTVNKKPSTGSGKRMLAHRIGEEIVAVVEGRSSVWDKRNLVHKLGTSVRANLTSPALTRGKRRF